MAGKSRSDAGSKHPVCEKCNHSKYYHYDVGGGRDPCKPCNKGKNGVKGVCAFDNIFKTIEEK